MSAYVDSISAIESDTTEENTLGTILRECETVAKARINADKSVDFWLGAPKSRTMPSDDVVGRLTDGPIKLLRVWFGRDLQIEPSLL